VGSRPGWATSADRLHNRLVQLPAADAGRRIESGIATREVGEAAADQLSVRPTHDRRSAVTMSTNASRLELQWLLAAGFAACLAYPLGVFAPLPIPLRTFLLAFFGPLLGLGSFGLFRALSLNQRSVCGALGAASNAIAGALFAAMILVQLTAGDRGEDAYAQATWLGLDVAWDIYIGVGTLLFAAGVYRHQWFGKIYGISGATIAVLLLSLNLWTFPTPPANAGLFDAGPLVGAWYLVVTVASWRGLRRLTA